MSTATIYDAFAASVTAFAQNYTPELPVAYPGINFSPPDTGLWLELICFWNGSINYGLADDAPAVQQGYFRIIAWSRQGGGLMAAQELADDIEAAFPKGSEFDTARMYKMADKSGPVEDDDRIGVPVSLYWRTIR